MKANERPRPFRCALYVGVIPGLLIAGLPFGFMSLLGVMALAGIVVNNAIVLLDCVEGSATKKAPPHSTRAPELVLVELPQSTHTALVRSPVAITATNPRRTWRLRSLGGEVAKALTRT